MITLTPELAEQMASSTLAHLGRVYPHVQQHWLEGPADARTPDRLHPAFHGSLDWHSCVHGWWQVLRIARLFPELPVAAAIRNGADVTLTAAKLAGELDYCARPASASFERPYGWAWLLALHDELGRHEPQRWAAAVEPLARLIASRLSAYLPKLGWPVRHGTHANTAFALILARRWALRHDPLLLDLIHRRTIEWFAADRAAPWLEPSGEDFLSPTLTAAALIHEIAKPEAASAWLERYLDGVSTERLRVPVAVSDRSDPRIAHLDGLNLSRAWCWRMIGGAGAEAAAGAHLAASLPHLSDDYMGEHWLATFALLALTGLD